MDIEPRDTGIGYPVYQRAAMKGDHAPMIKVERRLTELTPGW